MKIISQQQIRSLNISPVDCVNWVKESFLMKPSVQLPPKISLHPQGSDFFNTMPVIIPEPYNVFSVKIVHRIAGATPSLGSDVLLYNSKTGKLMAMLDADWITTMRTGAVAALTIQMFRKSSTNAYGLIGLGNTARATLLCLLETEPEIKHKVILLKYKDQAEQFIERFADYHNVEFQIYDNTVDIVRDADAVISCITDAKELLCPDDGLFREGCLVMPVHSRGFQNCDLFFDKVFGDDTGHVQGFRYFDKFKKFAEVSDVLLDKVPGRENDSERILSYNMGLGLHDAVYATKLYKMLENVCGDTEIERETSKFWV